MTNRLADSTSPYLLQHAHNPVDWYPWGEEALQRARAEERPIFLSIGYAACHWCHVMERESFENEQVARVLNELFVPIKVDREERPDLDEIYMTATQLMTHSGGWPMSVFLTPDLKPFYAGTYFPPEDRWGRPGFRTLLLEIGRAWKERRAGLKQQAERVVEEIARFTGGGEGQGTVTPAVLENALRQLTRGFDPTWGGFGGAPKFPPSMRLELLLKRGSVGASPSQAGASLSAEDQRHLAMVTKTLDMMARGGMYDQVGGGFHRYSVDERWLVPHFEKMLYDNALLARVYTLAYERTGEWYYGRVAREVFDYVIREMTHPEGGIYSTTDADSEGEEGKFFVWALAEVVQVLGKEDGELFCRVYDITERGNFEGHSIPNLLNKSLADAAREAGGSAEDLDRCLAPLRRKLWERREARVHPLLDDKILSGWNGLMIRAFAEGFRVFRDDRYREAAERAAEFVLTRMHGADGRLLRSCRAGRAHLNGYLEDYAYLSLALLDLHLATGEARWREQGLHVLEQMNARFWDDAQGGYFFTSHDHEKLITRAKNLQDGATPSGNSSAALALIRAAKTTGKEGYRQLAARVLALTAPQIDEMAAAFPNMAVAMDEYLREWPEGIRFPGAEAVRIEAFLSHSSVQPGGRIWVGVRMEIERGYHVNSRTPGQAYLIPTELLLQPGSGFRVARESYPPAQEYRAEFQPEPLSTYAGTILFGVELEALDGLQPGRADVQLNLRSQPCDDRQCYPPLEARIRLPVPVANERGKEQYPEVFDVLRGRATGA